MEGRISWPKSGGRSRKRYEARCSGHGMVWFDVHDYREDLSNRVKWEWDAYSAITLLNTAV